MRKGKLFRSALALGMAFSLATAPLGYAGTLNETESVEDVEAGDAVEEPTASGWEGFVDVSFGEALYDVVGLQNGEDISWLKDVFVSGMIAPEDGRIESDLQIMLNSTVLADTHICADLPNGKIYVSIPQLFDQAVALDIQSLMKSAASVSAGGNGGSLDQKMVQMFVNMGTQLISQVAEVIQSIPAEVWQEEMMSYVKPVMDRLVQKNGKGVLTVGDLSADVETQTFQIPSDSMKDIISDTLTALANDKVVETLLQSDAVSNVLNFVSSLIGQSVNADGNAILELYRSLVGQVADNIDFSNLPGFSVTIQTGTDKAAAGIAVELEMGGESYEYYTFKSIADGSENAFEFTPGAMMMSMYGLDPTTAVKVCGQGSTEGGFLNETVVASVDDEAVVSFTIEDLDLTALQTDGTMIGKFIINMADMEFVVEYGVDEYDTRYIHYTVDGEVFYHADYWGGEVENPVLNEINREEAVEISSVEGIQSWLETFKAEEFMETLAEAGVPLGESTIAA